MADDLGTAVLRITVNDKAAKDSLDALRSKIEELNRGTAQQASRQRQARTTTVSTQRQATGTRDVDQNRNIGAFLRDIRLREESEKRAAQTRSLGYRDAINAERLLTGQVQERAKAERNIAAEARRRELGGRVGGAISSGLIGGGFPLLFGQGTGAALGGGIGGLAGGAIGGGFGFALGIVGTAIGGLADRFKDLARDLEEPSRNLDKLKEASLLSGRGVETLAETLVSLGRTAEADAVIRQDIGDRLSPQTVLTIASANDAYSRSISDVQTQLGAILAGPAQNFAAWLADIAGRISGLPANGGTTTERGALAQRGQGAALGISGTLLAALGLATAVGSGGVLAKPGLALAAGGTALAATGSAQISAAEFREQELAAAKALEPILDNIFDIEGRRAQVQRDIIKANLTGNTAAERELKLQDSLLSIEQKRQEANARFTAAPVGSADTQNAQFRALKAEREALNISEAAARATFEREAKLREAARIPEVAKNEISLANAERQLGFVREIAAIGTGAAREELQARQQILESIAQARDRIAQIDADIKAAEIVGDPDKVASLAQQRAAAETQLVATQVQGATALRDLEAQRVASDLRRTTELGLQAQAIQQQIAAAQELGQTEAGAVRQTLELRQQVAESIRAARAQEATIGAEIGAARIVGDERRASELVAQQKIAGDQTRLALIQGSNALRDAGAQLRKDAEDTANSLQNLRVNNLQFQTPQEQRRTFEAARAAAQREANIAGVNFRAVGTLQERTRQLQGFADFRRQERGLVTQGQDIAAALATVNQPLIASNQALVSTNNELATSVAQLASKDWNVVVNVEGGNGAQVIGDVVGALE